MAGEDESKDLQDGEDSYYRRLVSEEGGFGVNNQQLTDTDEQPGYDDSSGFTGFGDDDAYSMVDDDDADEDDFDDEDFDNDAEDFDGDDDDYDNEYGYDDYDDYDDDEDDEDEDENDDDEDDEDEDENDEEDDDEDGEGGGKGEKGKKDKNQKGKGNGADKGQFTKVKKRKISPEERAAMKAKKDEIFAKKLGVKFIWHEGEEITLETLQQYWSVFAKHVESLKEPMKQADEALKSFCTMNSAGDPNSFMSFYKFCTDLFKGKDVGFIQAILNIIGKPMMTLCLIVFSCFKLIRGGLECWTLATLNIVLKAFLKADFVQRIMNLIFSKGMKELKKKFNYKGIVVVPK